jgi:hypothetical protein
MASKNRNIRSFVADKKPRCPRCATSQHVIVGSGKPGERVHYCQKCLGMFDDEPDEGGDFGDRPDARMIRAEQKPRRAKGNDA